MRLIYSDTKTEVQVGDVVKMHNHDTPMTVKRITEPHKPGSTGRVYVRPLGEDRGGAEYFPSVIGAEWIERTDQ